jgi:hypothetical protein
MFTQVQSHTPSTHTHQPAGGIPIGAVNDHLEQEADAMADRVMRMPLSGAEFAGVSEGQGVGVVQRKCAACEDDQVQRKEKSNLAGGGHTHPQLTQQIHSTRGGGHTLDSHTRNFMESGFGRDFSQVKVHTGDYAASMSHELHAKAFTIGQDIYFNSGQYQPSSESGRHLLAHELAHTLQQGGGLGRKIQRKDKDKPKLKWDPVGNNCPDVHTDRWLKSVTVQQEMPQHVTLNWDDGSSESHIASTGKGLCCGDTADAVACDAATSQNLGTNCTPITSGKAPTIDERELNHGGWEFWNTFVGWRGIALHQHHTVKGEPLSHGCVRLQRDTARRIFCGARQHKTQVFVKGFARPYCNSTNVQAEWMGDFAYAQLDPKKESAGVQAGIRETRKALIKALKTNEGDLDAKIKAFTPANVQANLPRCASTSALTLPAGTTTEQARVINQAQLVSPHHLAFATQVIALSHALRTSADLTAAQTAVTTAGQGLWNDANTRAQAPSTGTTTTDPDDRPLYWARLRMIEEIRRFTPTWTITATDRQGMVNSLESTSRGHASVSFSGAASTQKRILITGYDPFGFDRAITSGGGTDRTVLDSNPSGAAVLALNGTSIPGTGTLSAFVQGVLFPVRYRDFDASMVENLIRPLITGSNPPHMIMTISQGGTTFDIEQSAGRNRSSDPFADNEGATSGGTTTAPVTPPGLSSGPQFLNTTLPTSHMTSGGLATLKTTGATTTGGSSPQAVTGTGGGFLSNEIFYRVRFLRLPFQ